MNIRPHLEYLYCYTYYIIFIYYTYITCIVIAGYEFTYAFACPKQGGSDQLYTAGLHTAIHTPILPAGVRILLKLTFCMCGCGEQAALSCIPAVGLRCQPCFVSYMEASRIHIHMTQ